MSEYAGTRARDVPVSSRPGLGIPTPAPVIVDLDVFLEARAWEIPGAGTWEIPVPAPFALREGRLVAFPGPPERSFRPREVPWLVSDFAHLWPMAVKKEGAREAAEAAALEFANQYGLTGKWIEAEPPRERAVRTMIAKASGLWRSLNAWRENLALLTEPESERRKQAVHLAWKGVQDVPLPDLRPGPQFGVVASYPEPLDLLDVMRLQLMADLMAGRPVHKCEHVSPRTGPCGKLFIWTEGSTRSRIRGRGSRPKFCSRRHAAAAGQRERRRRSKGKG